MTTRLASRNFLAGKRYGYDEVQSKARSDPSGGTRHRYPSSGGLDLCPGPQNGSQYQPGHRVPQPQPTGGIRAAHGGTGW